MQFGRGQLPATAMPRYFKLLFLALLGISLLLSFSVYLTTSDHFNCTVSWAKPKASLGGQDSLRLTQEQFSEQYISLKDRVDRLGLGQRLVNSSFHYLSRKPRLDEPTERGGVLIGVVTTQKYLLSRVLAIYKTWAQDINPDAKLYFFVGDDCDTSFPQLKGLPIVKVRGVKDNVYPPQQKVFAVLKHMYTHFRKKYKWFMRVDDDVYMRVRELEEVLSKRDWTQKLYLGHPGYGKEEDKKRLKLLSHENYCMGGPGVALSVAALEALYPQLDRCLYAVQAYNQKWGREGMGWYNEDVELGRCISRTLGIDCTLPSKKYTFHADYSLAAINASTLWEIPVFHKTIIIHPVKQPDNMYSIHHYYKYLQLKALQQELLDTAAKTQTLGAKLPTALAPPHELYNLRAVKQVEKCLSNASSIN